MAAKGAIATGGLLLVALVLFWVFRTGSPPPAPIERQAAPQPSRPAPSPPLAQAPDVSGLKLYGLLASGAIVGVGNGNQRLILIGRDALPGLTLRRIEQEHAVFASAAGEVRLGFDAPGQAPAAAAARPANAGEDMLPYRLGLAPRRTGGRVTGFTLRPGADLPALAATGVRPGDVIVAVNGSALDEERMLELPWQIANSSRTEFEVERGGRRVRLVSGAR